MYFESHAHYDDAQFDEDREELLNKLLPSFGIETVINVASDMKSSYRSIALAEKYNYIYASVGVHPHEVKKMKEENLEELEQLCKHKKVVAVGEIGLDFYYNHSPKEIQKEWFTKQLNIVKKVNLPVIIHSRDAAQECFDMIKQSGVNKGVIHCYSGSAQMAQEYIKMGFYIGVGGVVTYNNAKKLTEVVETIPLEKILIETDSPYLSPIPNRGKRNDSRNLFFVTEKIAKLKKIKASEVLNITKLNAFTLFFK